MRDDAARARAAVVRIGQQRADDDAASGMVRRRLKTGVSGAVRPGPRSISHGSRCGTRFPPGCLRCCCASFRPQKQETGASRAAAGEGERVCGRALRFERWAASADIVACPDSCSSAVC